MLPAPPGAINPYLSNFQGNGLSFGSNVAPWAAGWSGPDMGYNTPGLPVSSLPSGMTEVSAAYGSGGGSGNTGYGGNDNANSGAFDPVGGGTPSAATLATLNSMRPTNLSGITVNAYAPSLPLAGLDGTIYGSSSGGATDLPAVPVNAYKPPAPQLNNLLNPPGGAQLPGVDVTNLAPTHVTATAPSDWIGKLANFKTDHPILYQLGMTGLNMATGGATALPGMVVNAMVDHANGGSVAGSLLPFGLGNHLPSLSGGSDGTPSRPASSTDATNSLQSLLASQSQPAIGSPSGAGGQPPGSSLITGGPLPDYAGLHALGNFGAAPVGGYWNQQALKMANPAYGPYAGYGGAPQPINYANPYAPSGLATAGY